MVTNIPNAGARPHLFRAEPHHEYQIIFDGIEYAVRTKGCKKDRRICFNGNKRRAKLVTVCLWAGGGGGKCAQHLQAAGLLIHRVTKTLGARCTHARRAPKQGEGEAKQTEAASTTSILM